MKIIDSFLKIILKSLAIFGVLFIVVILCNIRRQKEYYSIKAIDAKLIQLTGDSAEGFSILPYSKGQDGKIGVLLKFKKEFKSEENSPVTLFNSIEPGINGTLDTIKKFSFSFSGNNANYEFRDSLYAKDILLKSNGGSGLTEFYGRGLSPGQFVRDINKNVEYTKGYSFNEAEFYFWFTSKSDSIIRLGKDKLIFNFASDILTVHKKL